MDMRSERHESAERESVTALLPDPRRVLPLSVVERMHIERVLEHPGVNGNRGLAAELLGIGRTTLFRKLRQYRDEPKRG